VGRFPFVLVWSVHARVSACGTLGVLLAGEQQRRTRWRDGRCKGHYSVAGEKPAYRASTAFPWAWRHAIGFGSGKGACGVLAAI